MRTLVLAVVAAALAACSKPANEAAPTASASGSAAPVASATAAPSAQETAAPAARGEWPAAVNRDPFAGPPPNPGDEVDIPYAKGYVIVAPKGWTVRRGTDAMLTPPSGTVIVTAWATTDYAGLSLQPENCTRRYHTVDVTWEPATRAKVGVDRLDAVIERAEGVQFLPGGRKEVHKHLTAVINRDAAVKVFACGSWKATERDAEDAVIEAIRGIRKK